MMEIYFIMLTRFQGLHIKICNLYSSNICRIVSYIGTYIRTLCCASSLADRVVPPSTTRPAVWQTSWSPELSFMIKIHKRVYNIKHPINKHSNKTHPDLNMALKLNRDMHKNNLCLDRKMKTLFLLNIFLYSIRIRLVEVGSPVRKSL